MIALERLDEMINSWMESDTSRPFGNADVPGADTQKPFGVVYPIPSQGEYGSMGSPANMAELMFQITSVGETAEQCRWMASKATQSVRKLPTVSNAYLRVCWVVWMSSGGLVREDEHTYNQADTYLICVEAI